MKWLLALLLSCRMCAGALQFTGTSFVNFGDAAQFDGQTKFTIMAWVYMDTTTPAYAGILCDLQVTTFDNGWTIQRNASASELIVAVRNGSVTPVATSAAGTFSSNAWHHLAMVYDGTGTLNADRLKVYVDGVNLTLTFTGTIPASSGANTSPFYIGTYDSATPATFLVGYVDDVVWVGGRVLTQAEMDLHRQAKVRRLVKGDSHWALDGYPHGGTVNNAFIVDDGPNQVGGLATNCVAAASLFMSYPPEAD